MKKWVLIILAMLTLCGCGSRLPAETTAEVAAATETVVTETVTAEPVTTEPEIAIPEEIDLVVTVRDGIMVSDGAIWETFARRLGDAVRLTGDRELILFEHSGKLIAYVDGEMNSYVNISRWFEPLTDNPEGHTWLEHVALSGENWDLFACYHDFEVPDVPVEPELKRFTNGYFMPNSYFGFTVQRDADGIVEDNFTYWDNAGNLKFSGTVADPVIAVCEAPDGGLVCDSIFPYADGRMKNTLTCFRSDGSEAWVLELEREQIESGSALMAQEGNIYLFGTVGDGATDVVILKISPDGEILQEARYGGKDFDWVSDVVADGNGFAIYGSSQSRDGDFGVSPDGYPQKFSAYVDLDLNLSDVVAKEWSAVHIMGYRQGQPVWSDDPVWGDFSEGSYIRGIFDTEDGGYTVLKVLRLARRPQPPMVSASGYYAITIAEKYDAEGNLLEIVRSDIR